jgi:HEAT repeat protein
MAEVDRDDIPVLAEILGDERAVLRSLAGNILTELGNDGLARLKRAAESPDPIIRRTAKSALMDYKIIRGSTPQAE